MIEMDEGYFTIDASEQAHKTQKSGRGSKTKSNVMIMAESTVLEDIKTGKQVKRCRYFKAKVVTNHKADQTDNTLQSAIDNDRIILFTDQSTSYVNIADYVEVQYE